MRKATLLTVILAAGSMVLSAQVGQDLKNAGESTKDAAVTGAKKTEKGTKKAATATTKGVKKGAHKAASATEKGADKVADKTSTTDTK